jgi:hypothetical protein
MKILYVSLFPEKETCNELDNLEYFINSTIHHNIQEHFTYRLLSCHDNMVQQISKRFMCSDYTKGCMFEFENSSQIQVECLPFYSVYKEEMNEKRAHEIAWSKQIIYQYMTYEKVIDYSDYIFYNDADIQIESKDVYELCKMLDRKNTKEKIHFVNIPYVIKNMNNVVYDSFGSFILPASLLTDMPRIASDLYEVVRCEDNKLYRRYAPDWILRKLLLNEGFTEIRGESCNTKHYTSNSNYLEFTSTKIHLK